VQAYAGTVISGNIESPQKVIINGAEVCGNIIAGGDVVVWPNSLVCGDITTAGEAKIRTGAVVSGTVMSETAVSLSAPVTPLAAYSFGATGSDVVIMSWEDTTLPPGEYGRLIVNGSGSLHLTTGEYTFSWFELRQWAKLHFDLSAGPIVLNIDGDVLTQRGVVMDIESPTGNAADILFRVGRAVTLGDRGIFLGTYVAPNFASTLSRKATLTGALYGNIVTIAQDATIHGDPALTLFINTFFTP
jgi:carbonic anhydrase/acetyltransferase-like protein (isoleucine patch superfamily)